MRRIKEIVISILLDEKRNYIVYGFVLNSFAGILNALQSIVFIVFATRMQLLDDAGNLTIAFAIGNLLLTLGKFGVRNFQVTDVNGQYSFEDYVAARKVTTGIMFVGGLLFCIFQKLINGAGVTKIITIFLILIIYLFESLEDVYEAGLQKVGRLDISSMMYILRWGLTFIGYSIVFLVSKNMLLSLTFACIINVFSCLYLISFAMSTKLINIQEKKCKQCFSIIKKNSVLCISSFLVMFIVNCPKYIIDLKMSSLDQTCFGIIVMPIFGIELLSTFLFQPYLHTMSQNVVNKEYSKLYYWMVEQVVFIVLITAITIFCANWIGIPVLSFLYSVDLSNYHAELLLVLVGGGLLALSSFFGVVLTILREQRFMMYSYFVTSIIELVAIYIVVDGYGIRGVVGSYDIALGILVLLMICSLLLVGVRKKNKYDGC